MPKLYDHDRARFFQQPDGRIVFAMPDEGDFPPVGTTDRDLTGDPAAVKATDEEVEYRCAAASRSVRTASRPGDVVWT